MKELIVQDLPNICTTKEKMNGNHIEKTNGDDHVVATNGVDHSVATNGIDVAINGDDHCQCQCNHMKNKQQQSIKKDDPISYDVISVSANYILGRTRHRPKVGVICGTGLGALAETVKEADFIPYSSIPNFPVSTVEGHVGRLVIGKVGDVEVVLMQGRFHSYEGYPLWQCAMPVRVMKLLGVEKLIVTNAAGSINPAYKVGDFMLLKDHINMPGFAGLNPLKGHNDKRFGPRFFPVDSCYCTQWRDVAMSVASEMGISQDVHQGVYVMLGGPNFETVAEIKLLKLLGVDCVGMSTIPEVLVATHCGMSVMAMSLVTNLTASDYSGDVQIEHNEVMASAKKKEPILKEFMSKIIKIMGQDTVYK